MKVKTIKQAKKLRNTCWSRGGKVRAVTRVENLHLDGVTGEVCGCVHWRYLGKPERKIDVQLGRFLKWADKAEPVNDGAHKFLAALS